MYFDHGVRVFWPTLHDLFELLSLRQALGEVFGEVLEREID